MALGNERSGKSDPGEAKREPDAASADRDPRRARLSVRPTMMPTEAARDAANEDFLFHLYRGSELLQDSRVHEAKTELEYALSLQPRDPKGQDLLALVYFRIGLYPRAIQIYEELLREIPDEPSLKLNLALCFLKTGQADSARTELEAVVQRSPEHRRAWGYLGLAYQHSGDFLKAQYAFDRGGHAAMSKRMSDRAITIPPPMATTFAAQDESDEDSRPRADASRAGAEIRALAATAFEELDSGELSFALAEPEPVRTEAGRWVALEPGAGARPIIPARRPGRVAWAFRSANEKAQARTLADASPLASGAPVPVMELASDTRLRFPEAGPVAVMKSGLVLVRTHASPGDADFAVRLEAVRSYAGVLTTGVLQRHARGQTTLEAFGGVATPMTTVSGDCDIVLGPRPSHRIIAFALKETDVSFFREDLLLGFEMRLDYENGRLAVGDGESLSIVQLRGQGTALVELLHPLASLDVSAARPAHVRRESIVGWVGRLAPHELPAGEAPGGQRGLVSFSGDGTVLLAAR